MTLRHALGVDCIKICPDCGDIGERLINRCPRCESKYQAAEKIRQEREAKAAKIRQRRANGFGPEWD